MNELQIIVTVLILALTVWLSRFLPFIIFRHDTEKMPELLDYLAHVLPAAMMGLLVVYCFKDYTASVNGLAPALIASAVTAFLHLLKHKTILSITTGTLLYMLLIRITNC